MLILTTLYQLQCLDILTGVKVIIMIRSQMVSEDLEERLDPSCIRIYCASIRLDWYIAYLTTLSQL